jgi:hypothetical protein
VPGLFSDNYLAKVFWKYQKLISRLNEWRTGIIMGETRKVGRGV